MAEPQGRNVRVQPQPLDLAGVLPRCGTETLQACRRATHARLRAGGGLPGCPLVPPSPIGHVDDVLDFVDDMVRTLPDWFPASWALLGRTFSIRSGEWTLGRTRAEHCSAVTGRQDLLQHAEAMLHAATPAAVNRDAREALAGALVGVVLADVLPVQDYATLTGPLAAAAALP